MGIGKAGKLHFFTTFFGHDIAEMPEEAKRMKKENRKRCGKNCEVMASHAR